MFPSVAFGGSRSLGFGAAPLVASVVGAVLAAGASVSVGCAVGADAVAIGAVLAAGCASRLSVFAAFAAPLPGAGFARGAWSGSAVGSVLAAVRAGARVSFLAGGGLAVPLRARLLSRSVACVRSVAPAGACVFFLASPSSPGSLRVAAFAAGLGLPVFAFACGFAFAPAPLAGCAGSWVASSFAGSPCWAWSAAQLGLFGPGF